MSAEVLALHPASGSRADDVFIHVRFHPNAGVAAIDGRPAHLSPGDWLAHLWASAPGYFRGLAGGRAFFRIPRDDFDAILSKA